MVEEENRPLLYNSHKVPDYGNPSVPVAWNDEAHAVQTSAEGGANETSEAIDEPPPPYQSLQENAPSVTCRVCRTLIDVTGKLEQHVVKCNQCGEATPLRKPPAGKKYVRCLCHCLLICKSSVQRIACPRTNCKRIIQLSQSPITPPSNLKTAISLPIRKPPAGKKYVRCPCHCLLICKSSAQRIACPRTNCKRIIQLSQSPITPPLPSVPGMCKVTCIHCRETFLFNTLKNALARCPHCRAVSSVGPEFANRRGRLFLIFGFVALIIGIAVTVGTYTRATVHGGYVAAYIGAFIISLLCFSRWLYYYTLKVSIIVGPL